MTLTMVTHSQTLGTTKYMQSRWAVKLHKLNWVVSAVINNGQPIEFKYARL